MWISISVDTFLQYFNCVPTFIKHVIQMFVFLSCNLFLFCIVAPFLLNHTKLTIK